MHLYNTAGEEDFVLVAWTSDSQGYTINIPSSDNSTFSVVTTYNEQTTSVTAVNGYPKFYLLFFKEFYIDSIRSVQVQISDHPIYITATSTNPLLSIIAATSRLLPEYWYPFG